jgi:hypothetical protein
LQLEAKFDELSMPAFLNSTCKMDPFEVPDLTPFGSSWGKWKGVRYILRATDDERLAEVWRRNTAFGTGDQRAVQWFIAPDGTEYRLKPGAIVRKSATPDDKP